MSIEREKISLIIPVLNEEENLFELHSLLNNTLEKISADYEVIFIDDGSTDRSYLKMLEIFNEDKHIRIIKFRNHFGKSAALDAGFNYASGDFIVTLDADLQDDPESIPHIIEALHDFDVVCGWRFERQDPIIKIIASKIFNWLVQRILKIGVHDLNCGLKGFTKEAIQNLEVLGEMHRYIPVILAGKGFSIGEVKTKHNPRKHGKSKYGFTRLFKGLIDMLTVKFLISYSTRPAHIFSLLGMAFSNIGIIAGLYLVVLKYFYNVKLSNNPWLLLSILLFILGIQMISFGMTAEMIARIHHSSKKEKVYNIQEILEH